VWNKIQHLKFPGTPNGPQGPPWGAQGFQAEPSPLGDGEAVKY